MHSGFAAAPNLGAWELTLRYALDGDSGLVRTMHKSGTAFRSRIRPGATMPNHTLPKQGAGNRKDTVHFGSFQTNYEGRRCDPTMTQAPSPGTGMPALADALHQEVLHQEVASSSDDPKYRQAWDKVEQLRCACC